MIGEDEIVIDDKWGAVISVFSGHDKEKKRSDELALIRSLGFQVQGITVHASRSEVQNRLYDHTLKSLTSAS